MWPPPPYSHIPIHSIYILTDRSVILTDRTTILTDRTTILTDRTTILTDHTTILTDRTTILTDRTTILTDRTTILQGGSNWSGWSGFNLTTFGTTRSGWQVNLTTWSCWYCIQPGLTGPLLIGGYGPVLTDRTAIITYRRRLR